MTERNIDTEKKTTPGEKKPASPDSLIKGGKTGKIELSEDELTEVSGGCCTGQHIDKTSPL
jgi:bacteriocin-like protein